MYKESDMLSQGGATHGLRTSDVARRLRAECWERSKKPSLIGACALRLDLLLNTPAADNSKTLNLLHEARLDLHYANKYNPSSKY